MHATDVCNRVSLAHGSGALDDLDADASSSPRAISVLVIDDDEADFRIAERALQAMHGFAASSRHARNLEQARQALAEEDFDIALVDFILGAETGIGVLRDLGGRNGTVAPILLTGMSDQLVKEIAIKAGAISCIDKNELSPTILENSIRCTLHTHALEQKHQDLVIELERANRAKSSFFAKIGHELKTPLNAIIGYSDALACEAFGPVPQKQYKEAGESIKQGGLHLLEVIDNLLQHSISESRRGANLGELQDVNALVERSLDVCDILRRKRGQRLLKQLSADPIPVRCQRSAVTQAILNVLSNAIKYTPRGGEIDITVKQSGRYGEIHIRDSGIGMSEGDLAVALAPFGRVEQPSSLVQEGIGIGLPIVRDIMARHEGQLEIESAPGKGTTVILRLPIASTKRHAAFLAKSRTAADGNDRLARNSGLF